MSQQHQQQQQQPVCSFDSEWEESCFEEDVEVNVKGLEDDEDDEEDDDSTAVDDDHSNQNGDGGTGGMDHQMEDKAVSCFRLFVVFLLIGGMVAAGVASWKFLQNEEYADFEHEVRTVL